MNSNRSYKQMHQDRWEDADVKAEQPRNGTNGEPDHNEHFMTMLAVAGLVTPQ